VRRSMNEWQRGLPVSARCASRPSAKQCACLCAAHPWPRSGGGCAPVGRAQPGDRPWP
jgi:hypothetical protein